MEECVQIFAFLERKPKLALYIDPQAPNLDYSLFQTDPEEFKEYYCDAEEQLPRMAPRPRGVHVVTTAFVDSFFAAMTLPTNQRERNGAERKATRGGIWRIIFLKQN